MRIDAGCKRIRKGLSYHTITHPVIAGQWLTIFRQIVNGGAALKPYRHRERKISEAVIAEVKAWADFEIKKFGAKRA